MKSLKVLKALVEELLSASFRLIIIPLSLLTSLLLLFAKQKYLLLAPMLGISSNISFIISFLLMLLVVIGFIKYIERPFKR